ncbi:MAG: DUF1343 domain-containing protein [Bacteroidales bacterium]|nr:DUF1343 domain-containing protein [Bacteroidales bacterium]
MNTLRLKTILVVLLTVISAATLSAADTVTVGAARPDLYMPLLKGKKVALYSNHTGMVGDRHTLDILLDAGVDVRYIFSPEHGFRGNADAGEHINSSVDPLTGTPIRSLFGAGKRRAMAAVDSVDVIVTDIQDVGLRFYTYYVTMIELMNRATDRDIDFVVLDRPNPTAPMGVDGPILDMRHASGVGALPIPILHGMTLGELATMASAEGWLKEGRTSRLHVVPCDSYTHATRYELPIAPSPNLPNIHAIYLYPSTCFFEATPLSLGRGTDFPFEVYGHPDMKTSGTFTFTPQSRPGAKKPPLMGRRCRGIDLREIPADTLIARGVDFTYIIDAYNRMGRPAKFFTTFFELLAGNDTIRRLITEGADAATVKASWQKEAADFAVRSRQHYIYP